MSDMGKKVNSLKRIRGSLFFLGVYIYFFSKALEIPQYQPKGALSVRLWPIMVLSVLMLLTFFRGLFKFITARGKVKDLHQAEKSVWSDVNINMIIAAAILLVLYPILMQIIGFTFATILFTAAILIWGGYGRRPFSIALYSLGGTLVLLYTFVKLAYVPLPKGAGFFEDITISIYKFLHLF